LFLAKTGLVRLVEQQILVCLALSFKYNTTGTGIRMPNIAKRDNECHAQSAMLSPDFTKIY